MRPGTSSRNSIASIEKIQNPREVNWDSYKVLRDNLSNTARSLRESRTNTQREVHGLYLLDMLSFSGIVERIAKVGEKISQFLEGDGEDHIKRFPQTSLGNRERTPEGKQRIQNRYADPSPTTSPKT